MESHKQRLERISFHLGFEHARQGKERNYQPRLVSNGKGGIKYSASSIDRKCALIYENGYTQGLSRNNEANPYDKR